MSVQIWYSDWTNTYNTLQFHPQISYSPEFLITKHLISLLNCKFTNQKNCVICILFLENSLFHYLNMFSDLFTKACLYTEFNIQFMRDKVICTSQNIHQRMWLIIGINVFIIARQYHFIPRINEYLSWYFL